MTLEIVPIVLEFLDVFFEDLLGLPLDKKLEFCIDLLSETTFIFIPPYKMALTELKELKT